MRFEIKEGVLKKVEAMDSETSMIIPDDVTRIDSFNSYSIKKLISVTLPDSITHVGGLGGIANQDKWDNIIVSKKNKRFTFFKFFTREKLSRRYY